MADKSVAAYGIKEAEVKDFAKAFAEYVDSRWDYNHLHISVSNDGDSIHMSCFGLGKVNWSKDFASNSLEANEYPFYEKGKTLANKIPCHSSLCVQFFCGEVKNVKVIHFD